MQCSINFDIRLCDEKGVKCAILKKSNNEQIDFTKDYKYTANTNYNMTLIINCNKYPIFSHNKMSSEYLKKIVVIPFCDKFINVYSNEYSKSAFM